MLHAQPTQGQSPPRWGQLLADLTVRDVPFGLPDGLGEQLAAAIAGLEMPARADGPGQEDGKAVHLRLHPLGARELAQVVVPFARAVTDGVAVLAVLLAADLEQLAERERESESESERKRER